MESSNCKDLLTQKKLTDEAKAKFLTKVDSRFEFQVNHFHMARALVNFIYQVVD